MGTVIGCSQGLAMQNILSALLLFSAAVHLSQGQKSSLLWREDGRCGEKFPLPNGKPGQCDPEGDGPRQGPCCSPKGFCGNTLKHCECETCIDYSWEQFAEEPEKETQRLKKKETVTKPETDELTPELSIVVNDSGLDDSETETVQTRVGEIKGKRINTDGYSHYTFFGIPYAQPPVGSLRFKAPLPVRPWTKSLEAFEKGPQCYQKNEFLPGVNADYSEDCLHLNIYTEDLKTTAKPVMIWSHGGGFTLGSGNDYAPLDALLEEGVIVVTINYRLGSLGFLTFGNDFVSGNMGLKDQALAIQWVKQNIQNFGGNPNKITIFGESAGAFSVHAQVLSPWNFGQIQGAIAQSGTMLFYNSLKSFGSREELFAEEIMFANISLKYYNHPEGDSALAKDQPLMDLFTDVSFISPDQKTVQLMSKYSRHVFNYFLTQQTDNSLLGKLYNLSIEYTPIHADDLFFLMDVFGQQIKMSEEESSLSNHMVKYWTNFAKYGHPTPSAQDLPFWNSVTETEHNYMELKAVPEMGQDLHGERMMFWERMLWAAKEETIDRKIMYTKATQFLLDNKI